jgi:hypothetical protein
MAGAFGADDLLQQLDVTGTPEAPAVHVAFRCPMRYVSHYPQQSGDELRIQIRPLPGCTIDSRAFETLTAQTGNLAGLREVVFDAAAGVSPMLIFRFRRIVPFEVRPDPGFSGMEVALRSPPPGSKPTVGARLVAPPPELLRKVTRELPAREVLEGEYQEARDAFQNRDYTTAIRLLTRLVEYPENPTRAPSQELLGIARERNGQLAHARAEYQEYLDRYPDGEAAARVEQRLAALVTLESRAIGGGTAGDGVDSWRFNGGVSQEYRRDSSSLRTDTQSTDFVGQSALVNDVDFGARRRGERFDFQARFNGGYLHDLLPDGGGDETRVSLAYAELADRELGLSGRLGRQSRHSGGVLGTFDGLFLSWRTRPWLSLNLVGGLPVESTRDGPATDRQFAGVSADFRLKGGWDASAFVLEQRYDGLTDRRAIGGEVRYFQRGRSLVGLVDYDVAYRQLNSAILLGSLPLSQWTLTGTLDHRKSPYITTRNALIGQPLTSLNDLVDLWGVDAVRRFALERASDADSLFLGASRPLGERLQISFDLGTSRIGDAPASGGVEAIPGTHESSLSTQLIANNLFKEGDIAIFGARYVDGSTMKTSSVLANLRYPLWQGFRISPRLRLDYRQFLEDGSKQLLTSPSLQIDWHRGRMTLEAEGGSEFGSRQRPDDTEDTRRYWFMIGYRMYF